MRSSKLTAREYATAQGVSYWTVMSWLRRNWLRGVEKVETPGGYYYLIPANAPRPKVKRGPVRQPTRAELQEEVERLKAEIRRLKQKIGES